MARACCAPVGSGGEAPATTAPGGARSSAVPLFFCILVGVDEPNHRGGTCVHCAAVHAARPSSWPASGSGRSSSRPSGVERKSGCPRPRIEFTSLRRCAAVCAVGSRGATPVESRPDPVAQPVRRRRCAAVRESADRAAVAVHVVTPAGRPSRLGVDRPSQSWPLPRWECTGWAGLWDCQISRPA